MYNDRGGRALKFTACALMPTGCSGWVDMSGCGTSYCFSFSFSSRTLSALARWLIRAFSSCVSCAAVLPNCGSQNMRIVAEATVAALFVNYLAVPFALGDQRLGIVGMAHQHQHAVIMRAAVGNALHLAQQFLVVAASDFGLSGIARGIARRARRPAR